MNYVDCVIKRDVYPQNVHSCSKNIRRISGFFFLKKETSLCVCVCVCVCVMDIRVVERLKKHIGKPKNLPVSVTIQFT